MELSSESCRNFCANVMQPSNYLNSFSRASYSGWQSFCKRNLRHSKEWIVSDFKMSEISTCCAHSFNRAKSLNFAARRRYKFKKCFPAPVVLDRWLAFTI